MSPLLLDSSVWVAALDPDDRHNEAARRLVASVRKGRTLAALDLTFYEVANVAVRAWRSAADAQTLVQLVRRACPTTLAFVDDPLLVRAATLAEEHRLSVYDAAYVAAARSRGWTLVSGDHRDLVRPGLALAPEEALDN